MHDWFFRPDSVGPNINKTELNERFWKLRKKQKKLEKRLKKNREEKVAITLEKTLKNKPKKKLTNSCFLTKNGTAL